MFKSPETFWRFLRNIFVLPCGINPISVNVDKITDSIFIRRNDRINLIYFGRILEQWLIDYIKKRNKQTIRTNYQNKIEYSVDFTGNDTIEPVHGQFYDGWPKGMRYRRKRSTKSPEVTDLLLFIIFFFLPLSIVFFLPESFNSIDCCRRSKLKKKQNYCEVQSKSYFRAAAAEGAFWWSICRKSKKRAAVVEIRRTFSKW